MALMEPFELARGVGNGSTLSDVFKYVWEYVVCIFTVGGRGQQVVRSYGRRNALIGALLKAQLLLANSKQKVGIRPLKLTQPF